MFDVAGYDMGTGFFEDFSPRVPDIIVWNDGPVSFEAIKRNDDPPLPHTAEADFCYAHRIARSETLVRYLVVPSDFGTLASIRTGKVSAREVIDLNGAVELYIVDVSLVDFDVLCVMRVSLDSVPQELLPKDGSNGEYPNARQLLEMPVALRQRIMMSMRQPDFIDDLELEGE